VSHAERGGNAHEVDQRILSHPDEPHPFEGHSPEQPRALRGYGVLLASFLGLAAAFAGWFRASDRELPDRMAAQDVALLTVAGHKMARMVARDRVTSVVRAPFTEFQGDAGPGEVDEAARGGGLRRAIGELLVCPYCLGMWMSAALTASLLLAPRFTRWLCAVLVIFFGSEVLQIAYSRAESAISS
jgi:hypothetical protein